MAVLSLPAATWIGNSESRGELQVAEGEVLIFEANFGGGSSYIPTVLARLRWYDGQRTITTGLLRSNAPVAFAGPGSLEILDDTLAPWVILQSTLATTLTLTQGESATITVPEGKSLRIFQATVAVGLDNPQNNRSPTITFRLNEHEPDQSFGHAMLNGETTLPGPFILHVRGIAEDLTGFGANDAVTLTYLLQEDSRAVQNGLQIQSPAPGKTLTIERSTDLEHWEPILQSEVPACPQPGQQAYRLRLD